MTSAIYKRYKGSELGQVLVAEGSVDRALKGKHYKRGLMYEAHVRGAQESAGEGEAHARPG